MQVTPEGRIINDGSMLYNGEGRGIGAQLLAARSRLDPGYWQPYLDSHNRPCVELRTGNLVRNVTTKELEHEKRVWFISELRARGWDNPGVWNAAALTKDQWIEMQQRIVPAVRQPLQAWSDLTSAAPLALTNAWKRLTYEYQSTNDPGEAQKSMDMRSPGRNDAPAYNLRSLPLPITYSECEVSDRMEDVSANNGVDSISTRMLEAGARRCGELIEQTLIGTAPGMTFGPSSVSDTRYTGTSTEYGYTTVPSSVLKTDLHSPVGTSPEQILEDVQEMIETMNTNGFYGPFVLYHSTPYSIFLNGDYFRTGGTTAATTIRQRLMMLGDLTRIERLNFLTTGYQLILVQMDSRWMQALNGMSPTVMAWNSRGGLVHNYVVMMIQVPLFLTPSSGILPVVYGTTS